MGYVVYLDLIFIFNICMDYLLLYAYEKLTKKKKRRCRRIFASILGGFGVVMKVFKVPIPYILVACLMVKLSHPEIKKMELIKTTFCFYGLNILLGGCLFFLQEQGIIKNHVWQVFAALLICVYIIIKGMDYFLEKTRFLKNLYPVELFFEDKVISGIALLDTGNRLYDPFFHRPVMIGEYGQFKEIYELCEKDKLLWIPYHSIGKDHGMIPAIKMNELKIHKDNQIILQKEVLVAIKDGDLSSQKEYQFILHADLMN